MSNKNKEIKKMFEIASAKVESKKETLLRNFC